MIFSKYQVQQVDVKNSKELKLLVQLKIRTKHDFGNSFSSLIFFNATALCFGLLFSCQDGLVSVLSRLFLVFYSGNKTFSG